MENKAYSYIRFSTPEQLKGDSLRRQLEASEKYCKEQGLSLDTSLNLKDLGLSAYKGTHRSKGALGQFLKLVELNKIPTGSTLIIESLDRLSREQVLDALSQFTGIINAGVSIVTLADNKVYSRQGIKDNWADLIISITIMARANEESETKSKRITAAWQNKLKLAREQGIKLTSRCPHWLTLNDDRKTWTVNKDAVQSIELIYRKKLSGSGAEKIAKEMNQITNMWQPPPNKRNGSGGWQTFYVIKLLRERALIGEFQPKDKDGQLIGDVITEYYPQVIDTELFNAVQQLIDKNRQTKASGQNGKANNVFQGLLRCGNCGGAIHYIKSGRTNTGLLRCNNSRLKSTIHPCPSPGMRYDEFSQIFFTEFEELDVNSLLDEPDEVQQKINSLKLSIDSSEHLEYNKPPAHSSIAATIYQAVDYIRC